uniref:Ribosomal protein S7 n=1 Tax=Chlorokybus atmophyticus TaxID=3144 RepID=A6YE93_CHLAT|nr:ribosomal protein S7 [Chlorokybus atmophyticus]ABO15123.1 ribosomal protein S7 [Chlorokybus atmophyticus]
MHRCSALDCIAAGVEKKKKNDMKNKESSHLFTLFDCIKEASLNNYEVNSHNQFNLSASQLLAKFINILMKDGKKSKARAIIYQTLAIMKNGVKKKEFESNKRRDGATSLTRVARISKESFFLLTRESKSYRYTVSGIPSLLNTLTNTLPSYPGELIDIKKAEHELNSRPVAPGYSEIKQDTQTSKRGSHMPANAGVGLGLGLGAGANGQGELSFKGSAGGVVDLGLNGVVRPNMNSLDLFKEALENVRPVLEVRKVRVAGRTLSVPALVSENRSYGLALRWIIQAASLRKKNIKTGLLRINNRVRSSRMAESLAAEFLDALQKQGQARQVRDELHRLAIANRAFYHYRWWSR